MNNLKQLTTLLEDIRSTSNNILNLSVQMMNRILIEGDDIYQKFRDQTQKSKLTNDQIDDYFRDSIRNYMKDAMDVKRDMDVFIKGIMNEFQDTPDTNFLYQVWCGDVYDEDKLNGLKELQRELQEQYQQFNLDVVMTKAIEYTKVN